MACQYPSGHASRKITIGCLEALARQHCPHSNHNRPDGRSRRRSKCGCFPWCTDWKLLYLICRMLYLICRMITRHGRHIQRRLESDVLEDFNVDYTAMFLRGYLITTSKSAHACYGASHTHTHTITHTQPHTQPHTHNHHHKHTDTGTQTHTQT